MKGNSLARKLKLLDRLHTGLACTVEGLAQDLAVSRRTVFRDLKSLEQAGVNIRFDAQRLSYKLAPHFGMAAPKLERDELLAIVLAAHVSPLMDVPQLGGDLRQAMRKLLVKAPGVERQEIAELLAACQCPRAPAAAAVGRSFLGGVGVVRTVLEAVRSRRQIRITFRETPEAEPSQILFSPRRLTVSQEQWVVEGNTSLDDQPRGIALSQIVHAEFAAQEDDTSEPSPTE